MTAKTWLGISFLLRLSSWTRGCSTKYDPMNTLVVEQAIDYFPTSCSDVIKILEFSGHHVMDCTAVGDKAYFRIDNVMGFGEAAIACSKVAGGNLMSVRNFDEYRIMIDLVAHIGPYHASATRDWAWLGLTDQKDEMVYRWTDEGDNATYFKWWHGQPSATREYNCVGATLLNPPPAGPGALTNPMVAFAMVNCNKEKYPALCKSTIELNANVNNQKLASSAALHS